MIAVEQYHDALRQLERAEARIADFEIEQAEWRSMFTRAITRAEAAEANIKEIQDGRFAVNDALVWHKRRGDAAEADRDAALDLLREAENALAVGRTFAAANEPDPQHVTVTIVPTLARVRAFLARVDSGTEPK